MPQPTAAIVGAGIGGVYLAADLGLLGCPLRLHDRDDAKLADIRRRGGIDVEGERAGFAAIERVTTDPAAAVDGADIVVIVTGGTYQESSGARPGAASARRPAHPADPGQYRRFAGGAARPRPGGLPRPGRHRRDGQLPVFLLARSVRPASARSSANAGCRSPRFRGDRTAAVFARLSPLFPEAVAAPTVASTGFMNANAMLHVANCVGNAGRIDNGEAYKFYAEGVTPARRPTLPGDQCRAGGSRRRARRRGAEPGGLVRARLRRARRRSRRDLPPADDQQRRAVPGDRHAEILGPQIHRRGRAGRA